MTRATGAKHTRLLDRAKRVLADNWTGSFTKPAPRLYPHQWNWDSGFIAIGYSHFDQRRARRELLSLFRAQWQNGMLPHVVYHHPSDNYCPYPDTWDSASSPEAPKNVPTSGLTQPPIHATVVWHIYQNAPDKSDCLPFLRWIFPKLLACHRFLYSQRDVERAGLAVCVHPWETGIDNSPKWDAILADMRVDSAHIPPFPRKDLEFVSTEERPTEDAYLKFLYLIERFKNLHYHQNEIIKTSPFLVYDVLFNSILHRANLDLLKIALLLSQDTGEIAAWIQKTQRGFEELLWDGHDMSYHSYDLRRKKRIRARTASCAMPLYAAIPKPDRAELIKAHLHQVCPFHEEDRCVAVPTYDRSQEGFAAANYWRGPIWVNINWLICEGLRGYGFRELADKIRLNIIRLVDGLGFWEYYYPDELRGLGSEDFSWTAALLIDLLHGHPSNT
ncbi:MAG: trehalase family glycosidase [Acidobacteriota bacterium]